MNGGDDAPVITLAAERVVPAAPETLIRRIWSGAEWQPAPPDLKGLAIEYDDGRNQSVHLCVNWGTKPLAMSVVRFCDTERRISFFYSRPPPGVVRQTGMWETEAVGDGTRVRLVRHMQLQRGKAESAVSFRTRSDAYGRMLTAHMDLMLDRITRC